MDERDARPSVEVEGLIAMAHADTNERSPRVSLRLYREDPDGERTIQEVTLTVPQAERLGHFFRWFARRQTARRRRRLRQPDSDRTNESRGAS